MPMIHRHALALLPALLAGCSTLHAPTADGALMSGNPLARPSSLPFQAPPFDRLHDTDYGPAIEAGMRAHLAEIAAIAADPAPPTFANTIEPYERSGLLLLRASKVFFALTQANTNKTLQAVEAELAPKLAAHRDAIFLDARLYARVRAVHAQAATAGLDEAQRFLVDRLWLDFVRAGAELGAAEQTQLRALNLEESKLTTEFQQRLLAATKAGTVVVTDQAALAGLADAEIAAAAAAAKELTPPAPAGAFALALQNTTQQPPLDALQDRALRERIHRASAARGTQDGATDTRGLVQRLAELRAQKAKLLGFPSYADYTLGNQMAKTPAAATKLLQDLVPAATRRARAEITAMQALIDKQAPRFELAAWDWQFWSERVRKAEYDLDEAAIKPYFVLDRVLQDGVFFAAHELYGLRFQERHDIPVYHPDVRVFEVAEADGPPFALFYADYFQRDGKIGGAWMDSFADQCEVLGTQPVVFNVCNFQKPAAGQPALLSFDDVTTMFHEFGHALHGLLARSRYATTAGTSVPRDFVEFPSQFNEHWATEPRVFANYAKHWQTGAPMPADLVARLRKAKTFNQGFATTEYLAAALLDLSWHSLRADAGPQDVAAFEAAALQRCQIDLPQVPPRYKSTYFAHIWSGGYAAGYYAYLWSEVLDDDAWDWFVEHGGMTRENGQRYRDLVLAPGGTRDAAAMFLAFRGREPSVAPLLRERGLE